jgi:uncharacterized membrane protein YuzA (DUF378 family)
MNYKTFIQPAQVEWRTFLWSQARLVVAAVALFAGGVPPVLFLFTGSGVYTLLRLAWIISGVASAYLGYRWYKNGQHLFGGKNRNDTVAFLISVISGLNLGWAGLVGTNIGMSIASSRPIFFIVGAIYIWAAYTLQQRWNAYGHKLF